MKTSFYKKCSILGFFLLSLCSVQAQTTGDFKIGFKDYHSEKITNIIYSQDNKSIYTSDEYGKVLKFDANTYEFLQTMAPSDEWVQDSRLFQKDTLLIRNYSYQYSMGMMNLLTGEQKKSPLSIEFADMMWEDIVGVIGPTNEIDDFTFTLYNNDLQVIGNMPLTLPYRFLSGKNYQVSADFKQFAYTKVVLGGESSIQLFDFETKQEINEIAVPTNLSVVSLIFEKEKNTLFAITVQKEQGKLQVYNLSKNAFTKPDFTTEYLGMDPVRVISRHDNGSYVITVMSQYSQPLVILKNGNDYKLQEVDLGFGLNPSNGAINTERKTILYANNTFGKEIASISVYDYAQKKVLSTFPQAVTGFFEAAFLSNGSWLAYPSSNEMDGLQNTVNLRGKMDLKYFEVGTFKNRFFNLNFSNYLDVNHNINCFGIDLFPKQGFAIINGSPSDTDYTQPDKDQPFLFHYDFLRDQVSVVANKSATDYIRVQDYVPAQNLLLLSDEIVYNDPPDKTIKLGLIKDKISIALDGDYKFGKLSNDGNFILTIDKNDILEIRTIEGLSILHSQQLIEGRYSAVSIEESGFFVNNKYFQRDANQCDGISFSIDIEAKRVTVGKPNCATITDMAVAKNNLAMIIGNALTLILVDDHGVLLKNEVIPFPNDETPQSVSFNEDGTKFILNKKDGKNVIYDSKTAMPIGFMIHPDFKSHVFSDANNHFFSNIKAEQFLYAQKNGLIVPLKQVEEEFFNPEAILRLFSEPNPEYLKALNQADEIRKNYVQQVEDILDNEPVVATVAVTETKMGKKPNLYFLSIGIANYQDKDYRLRFPGKDALEMAQIYGQLNPEKLADYDDKFKGKRYTIYNQNGERSWEYLKYLGTYSRGIYENKAIAQDGSIWLEWLEYEKFIIWDFKNKTQDSIQIKNFGGTGSSVDDVISSLDNSGFFIRGDKLQKYELSSKKIIDILLPLDLIYKNFVPIRNNEWLQMEADDTSIIIKKGKSANKMFTEERTIPIKLSENGMFIYQDIIPDHQYKLSASEYWYFGSLKGASANGRYVFFTSSGDNLFYLDLDEKDPIPIRFPITIEYGDRVSINSEGTQFYVVHKDRKLNQTAISFYNFWGESIGNNDVSKDVDISVINDGKTYFYFKEEKNELAEWNDERNTLLDEDGVLKNGSPFSFDKVFVETLIDEQASSKNIKEKLQTFFNNAEEQDQIMVFLAGHGLLSKTNDFYFAPVDMDFDDVTQKGISFVTLINSLQNSKSKNKLLLIDACQSGKTIDLTDEAHNVANAVQDDKRGAKVITTTAPQFKISEIISTLFSDFLSKSGVSVFSAASGSDLAQEKLKWGNGAFTLSYINVLKKHLMSYGIFLDKEDLKTPVLLNDTFIDDLNLEVLKTTNGEQIPDLRELNKNAVIKLW
ncbi:MAG: caspase family protein [Aequorivita sp.]